MAASRIEACRQRRRQLEREQQRKRRGSLITDLRKKDKSELLLEKKVKRTCITIIDTTNAYYIGKMSTTCEYCGALRFPQESLNCCHNGKVQLPPLSDYPDVLKDLLTGSSEQAKNFQTNIRKYNSAFAFASFGASTTVIPGRGTFCFRIHGQIYHCTNTLHPSEGQTPQYGQLYIIEGEQAIEKRMIPEANKQCRTDVMQSILSVMEEHSPYVQAYK